MRDLRDRMKRQIAVDIGPHEHVFVRIFTGNQDSIMKQVLTEFPPGRHQVGAYTQDEGPHEITALPHGLYAVTQHAKRVSFDDDLEDLDDDPRFQ